MTQPLTRSLRDPTSPTRGEVTRFRAWAVRRGFTALSQPSRNTGSSGHRRAEATPSFGRLCRTM